MDSKLVSTRLTSRLLHASQSELQGNSSPQGGAKATSGNDDNGSAKCMLIVVKDNAKKILYNSRNAPLVIVQLQNGVLVVQHVAVLICQVKPILGLQTVIMDCFCSTVSIPCPIF